MRLITPESDCKAPFCCITFQVTPAHSPVLKRAKTPVGNGGEAKNKTDHVAFNLPVKTGVITEVVGGTARSLQKKK